MKFTSVCLVMIAIASCVSAMPGDYEYKHKSKYEDEHYEKKVCGAEIFESPWKLKFYEAKEFCKKKGAELLALTEENFECFSKYVKKEFKDETVWVGSWNGDNYGGYTPLQFTPAHGGPGAVTVPGDKKLKLIAICEKVW